MYVLSFRFSKKRIIVIALLLMALLGFCLVIFQDKGSAIASAETELTDDLESGLQEGQDKQHYPGEPVRVYETLDSYWQEQLTLLDR